MTFGFADALLLMRTGRAVRPVGWRSIVRLDATGTSFLRISETGAMTRFEPSVELILRATWETVP